MGSVPHPARETLAILFSWAAFLSVAALGALSLGLLAHRALASLRRSPPAKAVRGARPMPAWGWAALGLGALSWALAWCTAPGCAPLRPYTFTPLWCGYILFVNALCVRATGGSPLTREPRFFLALFPASALFWWVFEYLNRFIGNWSYTGETFGPWGYVALASLCFSTVLPAVWSTREWLLSREGFRRAFGRVTPLPPGLGRVAPSAAVTIALLLVAATACRPAGLYPLLWVAPLVLLCALAARCGKRQILGALLGEDWSAPAASALAGLVCGFFWEMWNAYSLLRWVYHIPGVDRFRIFEMPLLGYLGYLPFGLLCAAVVERLREPFAKRANGEEDGL